MDGWMDALTSRAPPRVMSNTVKCQGPRSNCIPVRSWKQTYLSVFCTSRSYHNIAPKSITVYQCIIVTAPWCVFTNPS